MMSACRYGPFSENLFGFLQLLDGVICVSIRNQEPGGTNEAIGHHLDFSHVISDATDLS